MHLTQDHLALIIISVEEYFSIKRSLCLLYQIELMDNLQKKIYENLD